jgi:hypothetical protein
MLGTGSMLILVLNLVLLIIGIKYKYLCQPRTLFPPR